MRATKKILTAGLAAVTLAAGMAVATESSAQNRRYYSQGRDWGRGRDNTGAAVAAGIAGLALGSMLSSGNRGYGYGYGGYGGYGGGYYAPSYGYGGGYGGGYGYGRPYYGGGGGYYAPRAYRPRSCSFVDYDRWGRPFTVRGRC